MVLTGSNPVQKVWVDKTEEKGSDVNLAAHLLRDAYNRRFEVAVLITNDSDLVEPVRIARRELNLPVGYLNPHQHHSTELKREATFMKRIRQADLAASQFPTVMRDSKGHFTSHLRGEVYAEPVCPRVMVPEAGSVGSFGSGAGLGILSRASAMERTRSRTPSPVAAEMA